MDNGIIQNLVENLRKNGFNDLAEEILRIYSFPKKEGRANKCLSWHIPEWKDHIPKDM